MEIMKSQKGDLATLLLQFAASIAMDRNERML
jgi:hypothetical protein